MKYRLGTIYCFLYFVFGCTTLTKEAENDGAKLSSPLKVSANEGTKWNVFGVEITGKILSDETNGKYSVIVTETPPNGGPPMHLHKNEDELFYVLKGKYQFNSGENIYIVKTGDMVRLPRGIPHNFINIDSVVGITMNTITPGGFENFFNDIAQITKAGNLSKSKVDSIANIYGVSFVKSEGNEN